MIWSSFVLFEQKLKRKPTGGARLPQMRLFAPPSAKIGSPAIFEPLKRTVRETSHH